MSDHQQTDETTVASTDAGASTTETGKDGQPFDAARAQSTIDALRNEIKNLKGTSKELDAAKARLKEIDDASKSETERLASKATEAEQKLAAAEQRAADLALQITVERAAGRLGFHDPDDAYRLIDRRAVELDDDGEPKNVDALLTALAKAKPHLVKADGDGKTAPAGTRPVPATPKPASRTSGTRADQIEQARKELAGSGRYAPL